MGDAVNEIEKTKTSHDYLKQMHRWRMAFFGLVILLAGIVIGAASMSILSPDRLTRPPQPLERATRMMIGRLGRELGLSPEQDEKIGPILQNHMQKLDDIRASARIEITEQLREMNDGISAVLTEEQNRIWQRWLLLLQAQLRPPERGPGEGGRYRGGPQERMRRGPGPFGTGRHPAGPNMPYNGMHRRKIWEHRKDPNEPTSES
jgi:hypothetical protein